MYTVYIHMYDDDVSLSMRIQYLLHFAVEDLEQPTFVALAAVVYS